MTISVRDGVFDLLIVAGPRIHPWPSIGMMKISQLASEAGLKVGWVGGDTLFAKGVIPQSGAGALVFAQDPQKRIHRWFARSVVRFSVQDELPDPFPGWLSSSLLPLSTAIRLRDYGSFPDPEQLVILGTGNAALRFGTEMIHSGCPSVIAIEANPSLWGSKRFSAWEVERRNFEKLGGKVLEGKIERLTRISPSHVEVDLRAPHSVLTLPADWVVSAGPFERGRGFREYPPGSSLYELTQTARATREQDVQGWVLEEERARAIAVRVIRALVKDLGPLREKIEAESQRSRRRLRVAEQHFDRSFSPVYQGKWMVSSDVDRIRKSPGVPQKTNRASEVAVIECIESIGCRQCQDACPVEAIQIQRNKNHFLSEDLCTACGACLRACPSQVPVLTKLLPEKSMGEVILPYPAKRKWLTGELVTILNRRGDSLGSARVLGLFESPAELNSKVYGAVPPVDLIRIEVPSHLITEARAIRVAKTGSEEAQKFWNAILVAELGDRVEIQINGEKRRIREGLPLSAALFESRLSRSQDRLFCVDGTCGLCTLDVDGVRKQACQTKVRNGMTIRFVPREESGEPVEICPCSKVTLSEACERAQAVPFYSLDATLSAAQVGGGKCHGQICAGAFRRQIRVEGKEEWVDWSFPWVDWKF